MTARIVFSVSAREDRRAITAYTIEQFGVGQAHRPRVTFERVLDRLADNPMIGTRKQGLDPPGHSFRYLAVMKRFVVVYQPTDSGIRVARILHGMRDLAAELDRDAGDADR